MLELFIKPVREIIELLLHLRPEIAKSKVRQAKISFARLYFLLIELRDSSAYLVGWLEHADRFTSFCYFSHGLHIIETVHGIVLKITELMSRSFANDLSFAKLLCFQNPELRDRILDLVGGKEQRLNAWRAVLQKAAQHAEKTTAALQAREYSDESPIVLLTPGKNFRIPLLSQMDDQPNLELVEVEFHVEDIGREARNASAIMAELDTIIREYRDFLRTFVSLDELLG